MSKDLRRGELDLLPMLFQSLMDFERIIAHYRLLDAGTVRSWKANRDQLVRAWDGLAQAAALYAATCPELGADACKARLLDDAGPDDPVDPIREPWGPAQ